MLTPYLVGLDLGQVSDYTALAIAERTVRQWGHRQEQRYQVRHLQRFELGTPYPRIVEQVRQRVEALPAPHGWHQLHRQPLGAEDVPPVQPYTLVIDATGVGRPVADQFKEVTVWPIMVTLTGGFQVHSPRRDEHHVPKPVVIAALQVALQSRRLQVARGLPEAETLVKEALNFRYKISQSGHDTYEAWRAGQHDDLLLAVALAIWWGERTGPPGQGTPRQAKATPTGNVLVRRD